MSARSQVLVVGATGLVGGKVVDGLLASGRKVRALVRPATDAASLVQRGVEVVRGDLKEPASLPPALAGVDAVITTAYGYARRAWGDSLRSVDDAGNRALVDAARAAGTGLFVFTSILTAEKAVRVPHFHQKAVIEDYLEASGVPFVSLRPGGFIDTLLGFSVKDVRAGRLRAMADPDAPASTIHSDDVARFLVRSLDLPAAVGRRIDLGIDPPASLRRIAATLTEVLGRPIRLQTTPGWLRSLMFTVLPWFVPAAAGVGEAMDYVSSGQYVADTAVQRRLFGPAIALDEAVRRWAAAAGLLPQRPQ